MHRALPLLSLLALSACGTLPTVPPHANVAPVVRSPPMQVCWVEYATDLRPAGYGLAGESTEEHWDITYSGLLIRHPSGDVLIDAGQSSHFSEEVRTSRFIPGLLLDAFQGGGTLVAHAPVALKAVGEDPSALRAIAISHIHGDHAGGIVDLPGPEVWLSQGELAFLKDEKEKGGFDVIQAQALAIEPRAKAITFAKAPYENLDESADPMGDGSVVFVPLSGHTPGSMGTFVNVSPELRIFHVGDAVNTLEAMEKRRSKSVVLGMTDHDGALADRTAARLGQLHVQDPGLLLLPAHDRKAWLAIFGAPQKCLGEKPAPKTPAH